MKLPVSFFALLFPFIAYGAQNDPAPKLVATSPPSWGVGVPSTSKAISISFDQPMIPAFTDWIGRSSISPGMALESSSLTPDRKTFNLNVTLQPAKTYVIALNEKGIPGVGFQNDKGLSAAPYFLVFQTAGNPRPEDTPPALVRAIPGNGATDVNPARVTSLVLTFDRQMKPAKHGVQMFEGDSPVNLSAARFAYSADGRTFTLYYQFKPMQMYRFQFNDVHNIGFASATKVPLWPVQMSFRTGQPQ